MIQPRLVEMWYCVGWMAWSVDGREQWDSTPLGRITSCLMSSSTTFEPTQLKALRRQVCHASRFRTLQLVEVLPLALQTKQKDPPKRKSHLPAIVEAVHEEKAREHG